MTKLEFLDTLRKALTGEVPNAEIESNVSFYEEYINKESKNNSEEYVLEQLGNPRLIAKTIIETYQLSHGPIYHNMKNTGNFSKGNYEDAYKESNSENQYNSSSENRVNDGSKFNRGFYNISLTFFQKLILTVIVVLVIVLFIFLGSIILQLFLTYGLPILLIYLIIKSFSHRRNWK